MLDHVPPARGPLEVQLRCRLAHLRRQFLDDLMRHLPALEHGDRLLEARVVLLGGDLAEAGRRAVADGLLQAVQMVFGAGVRALAAAQPEADLEVADRGAQRGCVRERPEVEAPVVLANARELEAREALAGVGGDEQITLVVAQGDIVVGRVLLDELRLQQQRLGFGVDLEGLVGRDRVDQRAPSRVGPHRGGGEKIRAHPVAQVARLADVDHLARAVAVDVDARRGRHLL